MATVTVVNAERTLEIEATSIVSGTVNEAGHLILTRHDGTPIDVGAVSGMQLDSGTTYSKVDAFTYVGDTDPGAVPDGSVWLDTNDPAGPFASETKKGLIEIATSSEAIAGTDNSRALTPAGYSAIPGDKVQVLATNANTELALPGAYPPGPSLMTLSTGSGWSVNGGIGSVLTLNAATDRTVQIFFSTAGGTGSPQTWIRQYHSTANGGGWTAWSQYSTLATLSSSAYDIETEITAYPNGWSRIYLTPEDPSFGPISYGRYGEILTYVDGTAFAKQTWTGQTNGDSESAEVWFRTGNAIGGWSEWQRLMNDPITWTPYTPTWTTQTGAATPSFGNASTSCRYIKLGRKVEVRFEITFGSTTNFGGGGTGDNWQFSLPVAVTDTSASLGFVELHIDNNKTCMGRAKAYTTDGFRISISSGFADGSAVASTGDVDAISPAPWVSGATIKGHFTYEASSAA